ncbi:MAG: DNA repair protein RecN [Acidobacteria bacterium]|nr:DNA repair protein RecN [Acidobacteriota bacterium]
MLRDLHIENYALIEAVDIEFRPGLNLLTGETGSGKSIVVDAVGLLLGEKASAEMIRGGAERARITGVFSPPTSKTSLGAARHWGQLLRVLAESGIELPEDEDLILQRDILSGNRSRVFVNNQSATVNLLKTIAPHLAEVHGQNEQQQLFSPSAQLELLDRFGDLSGLAGTVREAFELWRTLCAKREALVRDRQEWLRQMDLWQFQKREIEQANITAGEDERLEEEKLLLTHAARIQDRLASSYDLLYDSAHSAAASLASACRNLEEISAYDTSLRPLAEGLASARVTIEDIALAVRDRLARLEISPGRMEELENRLEMLDRLKRKYGTTLDGIFRYGEQVSAQLQEAESGEAASHALENQVREATAAYGGAAKDLSRRRGEAANELKKAVQDELKALAMKGTVFEARLAAYTEAAGWRRWGLDAVEFLISPNPGEPLRPLARIASGGEISRIMLALETVTDSRRAPGASDHTLIFDEVDAGIGGRAAETVGKKLRQLAERRQVLCVTHLPQLASFAHHHYCVEKTERNGRTATRVEYLQGAGRTQELARMMSGSRITEAVLKHATQLLKANS